MEELAGSQALFSRVKHFKYWEGGFEDNGQRKSHKKNRQLHVSRVVFLIVSHQPEFGATHSWSFVLSKVIKSKLYRRKCQISQLYQMIACSAILLSQRKRYSLYRIDKNVVIGGIKPLNQAFFSWTLLEWRIQDYKFSKRFVIFVRKNVPTVPYVQCIIIFLAS